MKIKQVPRFFYVHTPILVLRRVPKVGEKEVGGKKNFEMETIEKITDSLLYINDEILKEMRKSETNEPLYEDWAKLLEKIKVFSEAVENFKVKYYKG